jgi:hypothetical protein
MWLLKPMKILIKQLNETFTPAYDSDLEIAKKIKVNSFYEFDFKTKKLSVS